MPFYLILTGRDCVEVGFSKSYGRHLFNWGIGSEKDDRIAYVCGYN